MPSDVSKMSRYDQPHAAPAHVIGARAGAPADAQHCRDVLDRLLRQTVISRLRLAHPTAAAPRRAAPSSSGAADLDAAEIEAFAETLRHGEQKEVDACGEALIAQVYGLDAMLMDVIPATAARLDAIAAAAGGDPADLVLAQWRLQELVERLSPRLQASASASRHGRSALIGTMDAAADRLRLQIAGELLSRDGWEIWSEAENGAAALVRGVRSDWFALALIGSDGRDADALASLIHALRRASCNPDLRILVMSAALARRPDRMARLGADAAAGDLRQAGLQARRLLALMPSHAVLPRHAQGAREQDWGAHN